MVSVCGDGSVSINSWTHRAPDLPRTCKAQGFFRRYRSHKEVVEQMPCWRILVTCSHFRRDKRHHLAQEIQ